MWGVAFVTFGNVITIFLALAGIAVLVSIFGHWIVTIPVVFFVGLFIYYFIEGWNDSSY